uniref:Endonuclease/exonuclease/phosphatase domain-containing protein n=1 Tax=Salvator merianae TaxID=96440 RepID=A0A8D0KMH1_SALMN
MKDPKDRFLFIDGSLYGHSITLANVYGPNSDQINFLHNIFQKLTSFSSGDILLAGDLNTVVANHIDRSRLKVVKNKNRTKDAQKLFDKFGLTDSFRSMHPSSHEYSFYSAQF